MRVLLLLLAVFSFASTYAQARYRTYRPLRPSKVVVVKPVKYKQARIWKNLGAKTVNMKVDSDKLLVTPYEGAFTRLKFKTTKAPVYINSMTIMFANGTNKHIALNRSFAPEASSGIIALPGNRRMIQDIKFDYKTIEASNGKAKLTVWGMH